MICQKCGKEVGTNDKFCQFCGSPVVNEESKVEVVEETTPAAPKKRGRPKKVKPVEEIKEEVVPTLDENKTTEEVKEEVVTTLDENKLIEEPKVEEVSSTNEENKVEEKLVEEVPVEETSEVTVVEEPTSNEEETPKKENKAKKIVFSVFGYVGYSFGLIAFIFAIGFLLFDIYNMIFTATNFTSLKDPNLVVEARSLITIVGLASRAIIIPFAFFGFLFSILGKISKNTTNKFNKGIKYSINSIFAPLITFIIFAVVAVLLYFIFGIAYGYISIY